MNNNTGKSVLKIKRKKLRYNKKKMALFLDTRYQTYLLYENRKYVPATEKIYNFSKKLRCTTDELLYNFYNKKNELNMSIDFQLLCTCCESSLLFLNITNDLTLMAASAGIYNIIWNPNKFGYHVASEIITILQDAINYMLMNKENLEKYELDNEHGKYEDLLCFSKNLLEGCLKYPDAKIYTSL